MKKVNLTDIPWIERKSPKGHFHKFRRNIARAFDGPKTGPKLPALPPFEVELVRLPPAAKNFPFHSHAAEWEFYLIVAGVGKIRAGKITRPLKPGDCVLSPPGEPHQILNTGKEDFIFYVIADHPPADSTYYPNSKKWMMKPERKIFRMAEVDYFDGEG